MIPTGAQADVSLSAYLFVGDGLNPRLSQPSQGGVVPLPPAFACLLVGRGRTHARQSIAWDYSLVLTA